MTADRFRALIEGAIELWRVDARADFDARSTRCVVTRGDTAITVACEASGLGRVWRIEAPGRTARVHRSVAPALSTLRDLLCPDRPRGRALFVSPSVSPPGDGS